MGLECNPRDIGWDFVGLTLHLTQLVPRTLLVWRMWVFKKGYALFCGGMADLTGEVNYINVP